MRRLISCQTLLLINLSGYLSTLSGYFPGGKVDTILPKPPLSPNPHVNHRYYHELPEVGEEFFFSIFGVNNETIFDTYGSRLFFGNQFLKIGTTLNGSNIYGLGEHKTGLMLEPGNVFTLWNYGKAPHVDFNLYGSHPFYMEVAGDGSAHGVFLRNSNGMDVELTETSLTYKVIGGVLDFYFFLGSTPDQVIQLYQEVIGRPAMPPYWALGFHQCRYGYSNLQEVKDMVENFRSYRIPLDTVWSDLDYMDERRDFTTDPINYPASEMREFVYDLHRNGQHYVVIINPAITKDAIGYKPYQDGIDLDIFIKDYNMKAFVGRVWPGHTVFPDFLNPLTTEYWTSQIFSFLEKVPVDGLWIDMNEPVNFCNGECHDSERQLYHLYHQHRTQTPAQVNYVTPPYQIRNEHTMPLNSKTLDMDAQLYNTTAFYNVHNLYGFLSSRATYVGLASAWQGKRPFVLSRSTFAGSGVHAAHWLGDNYSQAKDMYFSIPGILNFQMFGVPLVGADICGFGGATTEELCTRWMELGAFYPFSRNHNSRISPPQEPYRWPSVAAVSRKYLSIRYSLLPYYYTLFFRATAHSSTSSSWVPLTGTVVRPLFFEFPLDRECLSIDAQFLVGEALLISPQLELGRRGKTLDIYFPPGEWYDWHTQNKVTAQGWTTIRTPLNYIPIHIRGGYIIPMQEPGLTTTESRRNPYSLLVALEEGYASGYLYLDDGETYNTTEYTFISYFCDGRGLFATVSGTEVHTGFMNHKLSDLKYAQKMHLPLLRQVTVLGLSTLPSQVTLGRRRLHFRFKMGRTLKLIVNNLAINMDAEFHLGWR